MTIVDKYINQYEAVVNGAVDLESVEAILRKYSVDNDLYKHWLTKTGGGPIGPDWFDGIEELEDSQEKLANEPWAIQGFVVGWDGAGNPIVLSESGEILTEDHNVGGIHLVAKNFKELLSASIVDQC
jgi:hypothetical protein